MRNAHPFLLKQSESSQRGQVEVELEGTGPLIKVNALLDRVSRALSPRETKSGLSIIF